MMTKSSIWFDTNKDNESAINKLISDLENQNINEAAFRKLYPFSSSSARNYIANLRGQKIKCRNKGTVNTDVSIKEDDITKVYIHPKNYGNTQSKILRFTVTEETYNIVTQTFRNLSNAHKQQVNEYIIRTAFEQVIEKIQTNNFQVILPATEEKQLEL